MMKSWIKRLIAPASALAIATTAVVTHNEGYSNKTYYDGAGIATICYGETKGVKPGMVKTKSQCDVQLLESIESHAKVFDKIPLSTPDVVALGVIDMSYNIGVSGFNSSLVKKAIISGNYAQAGAHVLDWKYITINGKKFDCSTPGNKTCYGLWKRRLWQSKAIGNQFTSLEEATNALPK